MSSMVLSTTTAAASMATTTASAMDSTTTTMSSSDMTMVFFTSTLTPLFSATWSPTDKGNYSGTCIFLIVLAIIFRAIAVYKTVLERRWLKRTRSLNAAIAARDREENVGSESEGEKDMNVSTQRLERLNLSVQPWRLSVDLPRALLVTILAGIGYLLMIAVMTMNVGYFLSVLTGIFLGSLFMGRIELHR